MSDTEDEVIDNNSLLLSLTDVWKKLDVDQQQQLLKKAEQMAQETGQQKAQDVVEEALNDQEYLQSVNIKHKMVSNLFNYRYKNGSTQMRGEFRFKLEKFWCVIEVDEEFHKGNHYKNTKTEDFLRNYAYVFNFRLLDNKPVAILRFGIPTRKLKKTDDLHVEKLLKKLKQLRASPPTEDVICFLNYGTETNELIDSFKTNLKLPSFSADTDIPMKTAQIVADWMLKLGHDPNVKLPVEIQGPPPTTPPKPKTRRIVIKRNEFKHQ